MVQSKDTLGKIRFGHRGHCLNKLDLGSQNALLRIKFKADPRSSGEKINILYLQTLDSLG